MDHKIVTLPKTNPGILSILPTLPGSHKFQTYLAEMCNLDIYNKPITPFCKRKYSVSLLDTTSTHTPLKNYRHTLHATLWHIKTHIRDIHRGEQKCDHHHWYHVWLNISITWSIIIAQKTRLPIYGNHKIYCMHWANTQHTYCKYHAETNFSKLYIW